MASHQKVSNVLTVRPGFLAALRRYDAASKTGKITASDVDQLFDGLKDGELLPAERAVLEHRYAEDRGWSGRVCVGSREVGEQAVEIKAGQTTHVTVGGPDPQPKVEPIFRTAVDVFEPTAAQKMEAYLPQAHARPEVLHMVQVFEGSAHTAEDVKRFVKDLKVAAPDEQELELARNALGKRQAGLVKADGQVRPEAAAENKALVNAIKKDLPKMAPPRSIRAKSEPDLAQVAASLAGRIRGLFGAARTHKIILTWDPPRDTPNISGYTVSWDTKPGPTYNLGSVPVNNPNAVGATVSGFAPHQNIYMTAQTKVSVPVNGKTISDYAIPVDVPIP